MEATETKKPDRLLSLDALRGFDMFWIMGGEDIIHTLKALTGWTVWASNQLEHAEWNGFHFYDLIFPLFLFLSGMTMPFSLGRQLEKGVPKSQIYKHVFRRAFLLVVFGCMYNGLSGYHMENVRYASVLAQIGIAYLFAALIYLNTNWQRQIMWVIGILIGYWAALKLIPSPGFGADFLTKEGAINGFVDRNFFPGRLYLVVHDPEGWLVKIPATATALLGALLGYFVKSDEIQGLKKSAVLFGAFIVLFGLSMLWDLNFPINKNLWTSSFVLRTASWSVFLFAVFYTIIDVYKFSKWSFIFTVIGVNSITIYLATALIGFSRPTTRVFGGFISFAPHDLQPLLTAICFVSIEWIFLYYLYKKKIFLRV